MDNKCSFHFQFTNGSNPIVWYSISDKTKKKVMKDFSKHFNIMFLKTGSSGIEFYELSEKETTNE